MGTIEVFNYLSISNMFEKKGIETIATHIPFKVVDESIFVLQFEDFVSFMIKNQIKQIFIHEQYAEPEDYMITADTFKSLGVNRNSLECLAKNIEDYNNIINNVEFEIPEMVVALFIWNGQRFYYLFQNDLLFDGEILLSAEEALSEMIMNHEQDIVEANKSKKKLLVTQEKQLRLQIIDDPKFRECTNSRLRRNYIIALFKTDMVPKELKNDWVNCNGFLYQVAYDFIESVWREVKGK